jgi:SAM-dependent methyltransferase
MTTLALRTAIAAPDGAPHARAVKCCPFCDGSRSTVVHSLTAPGGRIAEVFELRECRTCGIVFLDPRLDERALTRLYDEDFYFSTGWSYRSLAAQIIELIQVQRRRRVERYVRPGQLLDIGSGDGSFVHHMARHGWDATGIDPSPAALQFAGHCRSGGRFLQGSLEDYAGSAGSLDLITMWQVLEHIGQPRQALRRCHDLLRPGGLLVASVPNIEGWSSRLTGERWWGLDVPRHLVHYSPVTLSRAVERSGLRVVRIRHRSLQYDPYALLHSSLDWVFTRRHFLSALAKRQVPEDMSPGEYLYNLAALATLAPVLAPLCVVTASAAACLGHGGFIEIHARRD